VDCSVLRSLKNPRTLRNNIDVHKKMLAVVVSVEIEEETSLSGGCLAAAPAREVSDEGYAKL